MAAEETHRAKYSLLSGRFSSLSNVARRREEDDNRVGSIEGNPSGRVCRLAEHEILPVSSMHGPVGRVALFFLANLPLFSLFFQQSTNSIGMRNWMFRTDFIFTV